MDYKLCYKPGEDTWCGDVMPLYSDGRFWLYHQRDRRNPVPLEGEPLCWSLASTADFLSYEDHGDVLLCGADDEQDQFIYAGSVMKKDGLFHAFYCGYNRDWRQSDRPSQVIMHAVSRDRVKWEKIPGDIIAPPPGYEQDDWRDAFVMWDEEGERYVMILAARKKEGPAVRRGSTVWLSSSDLNIWTFEGDFWAANLFYTHEMPDLFKIGDWWYLLYSEYSDKNITRYRMSKSMFGPWVAPEDEAFDGRAYYAARTATDGQRRYLFGWISTRANCFDKNTWEWGGVFFAHELYQRADGTLGCRLPESVTKAFGGQRRPNVALPVSFGMADRRKDKLLFNTSGDFYRLDLRLSFAKDTRTVGIKLFEDIETDCGYEYTLLPGRNRLGFDRSPNLPWYQCFTTGLDRYLLLEAGGEYEVTVVVDGDVCVLYVQGVALSSRMYKKPGRSITIYATGGELTVKNAVLYETLRK
jgi:beta-fructofuranosidase